MILQDLVNTYYKDFLLIMTNYDETRSICTYSIQFCYVYYKGIKAQTVIMTKKQV